MRHKLKLLSGWTNERRALAEFYHRNLPEFPLELPKLCNEDRVWHLYVVRTPSRDARRSHLHARGIETGLHYPVPLHRQPCLARFASTSLDFPESDRWANEGLSLPLFVGMTNAQQKHVVSAIGEFFSRG